MRNAPALTDEPRVRTSERSVARTSIPLVFSSSTTRYLGTAVVATEWFFDGIAGDVRTDDDLAASFAACFE